MNLTTNARVGRGNAVHTVVIPENNARYAYIACGSGGLHSGRGLRRPTLDAVTCSKCLKKEN